MSTVPVGDVFVDKRTVAVGNPLLAVLNCSLDSQHVHSVDLETWYVLATLVVFSQSRGTIGGRAHAVFVVCKPGQPGHSQGIKLEEGRSYFHIQR
jgi:hypothetical protein